MSEEKIKYLRICPKCNRNIIHYSFRCYTSAIKKSTQCGSCAVTESHRNNPNRLKGENNPMFGRCAEDIWADKYSNEQVERLKLQRHNKQSKSHSGENNWMFGKPSPIGSGRGRSGRLNNIHFRSFLELSFLLKFYEDNGYYPETAETTQYKVLLENGKYYHPDFVDKNDNIYEIKPSRMLSLDKNIEKIKFANKKYGNRFKIITEKDLPRYKTIHLELDSIKNLILNKRT